VLLLVAAVGSTLFAVSDHFVMLLVGRTLLGVASAMTAGLKALVLWFPGDRVPLLNGLMVMLGALGAVTATLPADCPSVNSALGRLSLRPCILRGVT
jgi:MFS family permease